VVLRASDDRLPGVGDGPQVDEMHAAGVREQRSIALDGRHEVGVVRMADHDDRARPEVVARVGGPRRRQQVVAPELEPAGVEQVGASVEVPLR
jgi:hypothetical protein